MSGGSKKQTTTSRTEIPAFLQPYLSAQANAGMQGIQGLQSQLSGAGADQLVAGFTPAQLQSQELITNAMQPGGFYRSGVENLQALGQDAGNTVRALTPGLVSGLQSATSGSAIPGAASQTLSNFAQNQFQLDPNAQQALNQVAQSGFQLDPNAQQALSQVARSGFSLDPTSQNALQSTAAGNYLYGSPAFNEAVQASIRAANPQILSTFAQGGSGAIKGGLAQAAKQQAASDAFARLYGQERANQLSAAGQLGQFGLSGQQQRLAAAGQLGEIGLAGQQQRLAAAGQLGQFGLAGRGQQIDAASNLGSLGIQDQGLRNQALATLMQGVNAERGREFSTAQMIPGMGLMGAEALNQVGGQQQALEQQRLMAPITANQMLLAASNGLPIGSLLGQTQSSPLHRNTGAGILGGAGLGLGLGAMTAAPGATGLAALGGPLGIGLALGGGLLGGLL